MHPPRVVGLLLATASIAQAAYISSGRIPSHVEKAVGPRADDAQDQASSTADNLVSDLLPSNTVTTNLPKTTEVSKTTAKATTDKPPETTKDDTKPTSTDKTTDPSPTPANPTPTGDDSTPSRTTPAVSTPTSMQAGDGGGNNGSGDGNSSLAPTPTDSGSGSRDDHTVVTDTPSVVVETRTTVITTTNAAGQEVVETTTTRTTTTPDLNDDGDSDAAQGMSPETKKTVVGVVVGVGGAIVLGALGFVAWRLHGRKKNMEESDGLMSYDPNNHRIVEKLDAASNAGGSMGSHPSAANNPFQSTLENYHRPTQVNTSANF